MINYLNNNKSKFLFFILATYAYSTSFLAGISFDELFVITRGEERLKYLYSFGGSKITFDHNQFFPGLFDTLAVFFTQLFPKQYTINSLHLVNTTFSILTLVGSYKLAKLTFNQLVATILILLVYFNPIFFGHMAINSKDTIITFSFVWLLITFLKYLKNQNHKQKRRKLLIYACLFLSLGIGTRIQFLGLLLFFIPFLIIDNKIKDINFSYKTFLKDLLIILSVSYFFMISAWPHVHLNIFTEPFKLLLESLELKNGPPTFVFNSEVLNPSKVPYNYYLLNLLYRSPEYIIYLYIIFIFTLITDYKFYKKNFNDFSLTILLSSIITIFPTLLIISTDLRVFDGIRYFLFILPFYLIIPSVTIYYLLKNIKKRIIQFNLMVIIVLMSLYITVFIKINPYQYSYINFFLLNEKALKNKFENDYWGISLKEIVGKINNDDKIKFSEKKNVGLCGFYHPNFLIELSKYPNININPVGLYGNQKLDYVITNNRSHYYKIEGSTKEWVNCDDFFDGETIIEVRTNKVSLSKFKTVNQD